MLSEVEGLALLLFEAHAEGFMVGMFEGIGSGLGPSLTHGGLNTVRDGLPAEFVDLSPLITGMAIVY